MRGSAAFRAAVAPGGVLAGPWVRNELWRRARAVPSLDLRFAENKSLGDAVTGQSLVTFTRASSGTYVGSDGLIKSATTDAPRFDHDPTTGESLGLLVEESRTNLLLRSEEFDDAVWTNNTEVTANTTVSPAGTTTADTLAISTAGVWLLEDVTIASGATLAFSIYAKANTTDWMLIRIGDTGATTYRNIWFDLSTGAVGTESGLGAGVASGVGSVQQSTNGFYRAVGVFETSGLTTVRAQIATVASDGSFTRTGSIYIWGAQLEADSFPTSYIPTTTATVTRAADVASISGSNFSSWYRQDEGTVFVGSYPAEFNQATGLASFDDGTTSNRIQARFSNVGSAANVVSAGGSLQANYVTSNTGTAQALNKTAVAYKINDFALVLNNGTVASDTAGSVPASVDRLSIGNNAGANPANYPIRRLTYWPQRLSNTTLQTLAQ